MEEQSLTDTYSNKAEDGSSTSSSDRTSRATNPGSLEDPNPSLTALFNDDDDDYTREPQQAHSQEASSGTYSAHHTRASSPSPGLPPPAVPTPPPIPLSQYPLDYQRTQSRAYRTILPRPPNLPITTTFEPSSASSSSAPTAPTRTDADDDPWSPHNPPDSASRQRRISQNVPEVAVGDDHWGYKDKMGRELEEMSSGGPSKEEQGGTGKKRRRDNEKDDVPEGHDSRRRRENEDPDNERGDGMGTRAGAD